MRGKRIPGVSAALVSCLLAACANESVRTDWLEADTATVSPGPFTGVETTITSIRAKRVWDTAQQRHVDVGQLLAESSTPLGKQLATAFVGSVLPAAIGGGFGLAAANASDCDGCGTNVIALGGNAAAGSISSSAADAVADAAAGAKIVK